MADGKVGSRSRNPTHSTFTSSPAPWSDSEHLAPSTSNFHARYRRKELILRKRRSLLVLHSTKFGHKLVRFLGWEKVKRHVVEKGKGELGRRSVWDETFRLKRSYWRAAAAAAWRRWRRASIAAAALKPDPLAFGLDAEGGGDESFRRSDVRRMADVLDDETLRGI